MEKHFFSAIGILLIAYFIVIATKKFFPTIYPLLLKKPIDLLTGTFDFQTNIQTVRSAYQVLRGNLWFFFVPLVLFLPQSITQLVLYIKNLPNAQPDFDSPPFSLSQLVFVESFLNLRTALYGLNKCLSGAMGYISLIPWLALIPIIIIFLIIIVWKWKKTYPATSNLLLKTLLVVTFLAWGIYAIMGFITPPSDIGTGNIIYITSYSLTYMLFMIILKPIWMISLLTILLARMDARSPISSIGRNIIAHFKPIFLYLLILTGPVLIPSLISNALMLNGYYDFAHSLSRFKNVMTDITLFIEVILAPLIYITIIGDQNIVSSFSSTIRLYKNHLREAGGYILLCFLTIFIIKTLKTVTVYNGLELLHFGLWNLALNFVTDAIVIFVSCIFIIGLIQILRRTKSDWQNPTPAQPPQQQQPTPAVDN